MLEDDADHPIPRVGTLDTVVETNRGAYFGLVIASPFTADARSEARLKRKLEGYFEHIRSARTDWLKTHSEPMEAKLTVAVHHGSDPRLLVILNEASKTAEKEKVSFELASIDDEYKIHESAR